jgi:ribosomal protein L16 Arg81 hydroxylase
MSNLAPSAPGFSATPIERRAMMSAAEFRSEYMEPQKPVIITGALANFRAVGEWNHEFFVRRFGSEVVPVLHYRHPSRGKLDVRMSTIAEYFELLRNPSQWADPDRPPYLEGYGMMARFPELKSFLGKLPFYSNWFRWLPARIAFHLYGWHNVLISPPNAVYNLHVDQHAAHACILQFCGRKRFVLFPPSEGEALYQGKVDPDAPDYEKYPNFKNASGRMEGVLSPGEIAFVPHMWWHQVTTLDESVSVVEHAVNSVNAAQFIKLRLLS